MVVAAWSFTMSVFAPVPPLTLSVGRVPVAGSVTVTVSFAAPVFTVMAEKLL